MKQIGIHLLILIFLMNKTQKSIFNTYQLCYILFVFIFIYAKSFVDFLEKLILIFQDK
jgi:hypothetical protein